MSGKTFAAFQATEPSSMGCGTAARWEQSSQRSLPFQLTFAVITLGVIGILLLAGFVNWAMLLVDSNAAEREKTLISRAIDEQIAAIRRDQQKVTLGGDAYAFIKMGDLEWMSENVALWMYSSYGHEQGYILDGEDKVVFAAKSGNPVPLEEFDEVANHILPLASKVRKLIEDDRKAGEAGVGEIMSVSGKPSIVAVRPILPSIPNFYIQGEEEFLHVAVKHVDDEFFESLGERYLVANVRFRPRENTLRGQNSVPLAGDRDWQLGYVAWDRERPGLRLIKESAPGLVAAAFGVIFLVIFLLVRLRRSAVLTYKSESRAQYLALHDLLTGMPNRALLFHKIDSAFASASEFGHPFALLYLDLDGFKNVNDTLGHPMGDELIKKVSDRLVNIAAQDDTVARLGGDEFAIIRRNALSYSDAEKFADAIIEAMMPPFNISGNQVFMSACIGLAMAPDFANGRSELLRKADIALYEAKRIGSGKKCIFYRELDDAVRDIQETEEDLREALSTNSGLYVAYQPIFGKDGVEILGAEALIRWDHPSRGSITPSSFIPVAEDRGLIQQLGKWVLREACEDAKKIGLPWVAVNVSAIQFRDPNFSDQVIDLLDELEIQTSSLQIEITERLLLDQTHEVQESLGKLRSAGIRIALDDFGTGYSSLQYLSQYGMDKIKIDRSFVDGLFRSDSTGPIVRAVLDLAQGLSLNVTAEGVENEDQLRMLRKFGCDEFQGFLLSKPISKLELASLYAERSAVNGRFHANTICDLPQESYVAAADCEYARNEKLHYHAPA